MPIFDPKADTPTWQSLNGEYPFEIIAVDSGLSNGTKTNGSDSREVKLKFYENDKFEKPIAQWTETFIDHESTAWKYSVFAKCVGLEFASGQSFDIDAAWIGRRGWANCKPQADRNDAAKQYNRVAQFLTNKGRLSVAAVIPAATGDDDLPF
jgi:hypothetical protein